MIKKFAPVLVIVVLLVGTGFSQTGSNTAREVEQTILESYEYSNKNLTTRMDEYSQDGSLEFWSSGGLLHEITRDTPADYYESLSIHPKHIQVVTLVEGKAAVAHYYAEGSMKPKGLPAVSHYMTRATIVYVKEADGWKVRSAHYSPISGGSGTSQSSVMEE